MDWDSLDHTRICYYVELQGRKWVVRFDHSTDPPQLFDDQQTALSAARAAAGARWEVFGLASCVKFRDERGILIGDLEFG